MTARPGSGSAQHTRRPHPQDAITEVIPVQEPITEVIPVPAGLGATPADAPKRKPVKKGYHAGLDLLRVLMAIAVVYTHLTIWVSSNEILWPGHTIVHRGLTTPLNLNLNLSFVGVGAFLLISGIVITKVADRESPTRFMARRLIRILPAMWLVVIVMYFLVQEGLVNAEGGEPGQPVDLLANLTLGAYFETPSAILLGVTWTLIVQLIFYTYVALTIPLLRRYPWLPALLGAALVSIAQSWAAAEQNTGIVNFRIGMFTSYLPVLFIGQLISLGHTRRIPIPAAIALGSTHFMLFLSADLFQDYITTGVAHSRTLLLLIMVVLLVMNSTGRLATSPLISAISKRSYSIYLVHTACIYPIMGLMTSTYGVGLAIVTSLAAVVVATELLHRCIEMPPVRLHRRFERYLDGRRGVRRAG
ncbi:acyltransferase family protein [Actinoalloteichus hymeniacidonis]|uniref:Acyltransferase n=1 Tax=Actinoalloteichus hymeniacidonis TaxID=340345 RepID=A0AAC9HKH9_9PSEU|nr:acyltransferase [Actinoalloteichus hymeniacidonis]AOS60910.1 putative acyltransferase [Actinoalloteichus hymeniacidonis]MBB5911090.1 peptidoglycan/LPS O-acetylase OafA/YrhL [Actinoalloteichus hymeniacidonis]